MLSVCLASFMIGVLLGARFKILSICPAGVLLAFACVVLAYAQRWTVQETLSAILLSLVLMPVGYMLRAASAKQDATSLESARPDTKHHQSL